MELNYLRHFFEVAKAGSFTEAARRLHISQSALSKSVALLEDHEGIKLFERSKKGVALTTLGRDVFLKCERIFQTLTEIEVTCRGTKETCSGPLRFGASDHLANYMLVKSLQKIRADHPEVLPSVFSGTPNEIIEQILGNEIEFGLFFTKVNVPGIKYDELTMLDMAVVCSPALKTTSLKTAIDSFGLIGSIKAQYQHHPSQELMKVLGSEPNIAFESNSQEAQKRLCLEGAGVAYLTRFMVEKELASGKLVEIPLKKTISIPLHLASRRGRELSLNARTFLSLLDFSG